MNRRTIQELDRRLRSLNREKTSLRKGVVTSISPLTVELGDAGVTYSSVYTIGPCAINDVVAVIVRDSSLLVLGVIVSTPPTYTGGSYQPVDGWRTHSETGSSHLIADIGFTVCLFVDNGAQLAASGFNNLAQGIWQTYINGSDHGSVSGKTLKYRIVATAITNNTDLAQDLIFQLYTLTPVGAADAINMTASASAGSSATITNALLGTNAQAAVSSAAFSAPTSGIYGMTCTASGTIANNSTALVKARLEYSWQ